MLHDAMVWVEVALLLVLLWINRGGLRRGGSA